MIVDTALAPSIEINNKRHISRCSDTQHNDTQVNEKVKNSESSLHYEDINDKSKDNHYGNNHNDRNGYSSNSGRLLGNLDGHSSILDKLVSIQNTLLVYSCSGDKAIGNNHKTYGKPLGNFHYT